MDNSGERLVDIFFYGLHMDAASLRQQGIVIRQPRLANILHHKVAVREKAMLLREKDALACGMPSASIDTEPPDDSSASFHMFTSGLHRRR